MVFNENDVKVTQEVFHKLYSKQKLGRSIVIYMTVIRVNYQ